MGGANTECWHTLRLWREAGWQVTMIPTWGADSYWEERLNSIGVKTHHVDIAKLETVPGLAGSVVVGMCNQHFCRTRPEDGGPADNFARLKAMGCKTIWAPCMTFIFDYEVLSWTRHGLPDGFMFQSEFQRDRFAAAYKRYGYQPEQGHLIRGAFFPDEFPFRRPASRSSSASSPGRTRTNGARIIGKSSRPSSIRTELQCAWGGPASYKPRSAPRRTGRTGPSASRPRKSRRKSSFRGAIAS
jgi:hypothetical protein